MKKEMDIKTKLKDAINSAVMGRPVYFCDYADQRGMAYYKVEIDAKGFARNGHLQTLPLSLDEYTLARNLIEDAKSVFTSRMEVVEKQNALYEPMNTTTFRASVTTRQVRKVVYINILIEGDVPKDIPIQKVRLQLLSKLKQNYDLGIVDINRISHREIQYCIPSADIPRDMEWLNHLNDNYTATITRAVEVDRLRLIGPGLPGED